MIGYFIGPTNKLLIILSDTSKPIGWLDLIFRLSTQFWKEIHEIPEICSVYWEDSRKHSFLH